MSFSIIAGSYEKLLYGLRPVFSPSASDSSSTDAPKLKPFFIFPAHNSCIKAIAGSPGGKWLATGSTDEIIKIWDLRRRKEVGGLVQHDGSITYLDFPTRSHLVSASDDGTICLFHARDWAVLRILKGHKTRINCVAVHPSSKLALSVGKDRTLRMWDLMRGKGSASTKIGKEGEILRWSRSGTLFALTAQMTLDVFKTDMTLVATVTHKTRLHDIRFAPRPQGPGELLLVAAEDKTVFVYAIDDTLARGSDAELAPPVLLARLTGHGNRVKGIDVHVVESTTDAQTRMVYVCSASSDGFIRLFDLSAVPQTASPNDEPVSIECISSYDTQGTRLTCIAFADAEDASLGKRKRQAAADSDDEEEAEVEGLDAKKQRQDDKKADGAEDEVEDDESGSDSQ